MRSTVITNNGSAGNQQKQLITVGYSDFLIGCIFAAGVAVAKFIRCVKSRRGGHAKGSRGCRRRRGDNPPSTLCAFCFLRPPLREPLSRTPKHRTRVPALLLFFLTTALAAQEPLQPQLIEDAVAEEAEAGGEFTFNAAFSTLEAYLDRPLDLNRATYEELTETYLLSPIQVDKLLDYREKMNGLLSIYELQAVPGMDLETIRKLQPYVRVGSGLDDVKTPLAQMLKDGDRELFLRTSRRLETARGYRLGPADSVNYYLGNPSRVYTRFRQRYGNQLSFGIVAEKDPGERGVDYLSAHVFLSNVSRRIKTLALGDFTVSFGQGLILYSGFGFGKSSLTTTVARTATTLKPYASVNEANFMRGAAATLAFGKNVAVTAFASRRGRAANLADTVITSLGLSGLHRTEGEVADRNAIQQTSYGASVKYSPSSRLKLAVNFLGEHLSRPLLRSPRPYNRFFFAGTDLQNASVDYRYRFRNFTFFGELAHAFGAGNAMLHALQLGLDRRVDLALAYRRYDRDYQALNARPFGETSGGRNEEGIYLGLELRPGTNWRINAYYDLWTHPWLRFNVDAPSGGDEYRFRLTYWQKRKLDSYVEVRSETKGFGSRGEVIDRTRFQARLHFGYHINAALEWRSRFDWGFTEDADRGYQRGVMLYQDFHYRPLGAFSFSARFAVFDTDGYDVRFYQYENGLTYNAFVLPYYHRGTRSFLLLRYKGIRGLTLEARIAQTYYADGNTFGTGLEETGEPVRTEVGGQVIWRF